jgi:hypothetical protein
MEACLRNSPQPCCASSLTLASSAFPPHAGEGFRADCELNLPSARTRDPRLPTHNALSRRSSPACGRGTTRSVVEGAATYTEPISGSFVQSARQSSVVEGAAAHADAPDTHNVIPAPAGIQSHEQTLSAEPPWSPACAGMTDRDCSAQPRLPRGARPLSPKGRGWREAPGEGLPSPHPQRPQSALLSRSRGRGTTRSVVEGAAAYTEPFPPLRDGSSDAR